MNICSRSLGKCQHWGRQKYVFRNIRFSVCLCTSIAFHVMLTILSPGIPLWMQGGGAPNLSQTTILTANIQRVPENKTQTTTAPASVFQPNVIQKNIKEEKTVPSVLSVQKSPRKIPKPEQAVASPENSRNVVLNSTNQVSSLLSPATAPIQSQTFREPLVVRANANAPIPPGTIYGPWYFSSRYLQRHPLPILPINPEYPDNWQHIAAKVQILLFINEQGSIDLYKMVETKAEPSEPFETSVITAFSKAQFYPGLIAGQPVKSLLLVEITFEPGLTPEARFSDMELLDGERGLAPVTPQPTTPSELGK